MKDRKGFTLVELIIAIVLIAILGVILGFSINNMLKKSKDREYQRYVDMIKSSASTYVSLNRDVIEDLYSNKSFVYVTIEELVKTGLLDENLENPYTKEIAIETGDVVRVSLDAITGAIIITYPPTEKLNPDDPGYDPSATGDDEITLRAMADVIDDEGIFNCMNGAGTYKLALAKEDGTLVHLADASGNLDGTLISKYDINCVPPKEFTLTSGSRDAVVSGSVYRSYKNYTVKEGSYQVEYSWRGEDGKIHKINRLISVKGKKLDVKFDHNKKSDSGTLSVDHIVVINGAQYGTLATATRDNHIFGGWYYQGLNILYNTTVTATESHTLKAKWMRKPTLTVQGYNKSGSTMNASNGYVYKDVATITYYGPEDNNDTINYYLRSGSSATTNVTAYSCGTASVPGVCSSTSTTSIAANTWYKVGSATTNTSSTVLVSYETNTDVNVTLETYVDNASNFKGAGNSIQIRKIDRTAPNECRVVPSGTMGNNDYYRSNITFTAAGSDAASGAASKTVDISSITTDTKGTTVTATIVDAAGNSTTCSNTYKRDITPPDCTNDNYSNWTKDAKTVTWGCTNDPTSGCVKAEYGRQTYSTTTVTATVAAYTIEDNAGNTRNCPAKTVGVYVDTTPPSCPEPTGQNTTWKNSSVTISYGCSDGNSGCNASYSGGSKTYSTGATKTDTITWTIKDNVGNSTDCSKTVNVYNDFVAPSCTTSKSNQGLTTGLTASATCSDNLSGCTQASASEGNLKSNKTFTFYDNAGNSTTCTATVTAQTQSNTCTTYTSCRKEVCGVESYNSCRVEQHGCETWTPHCDNYSGFSLSGTTQCVKAGVPYADPYCDSGYSLNSTKTACRKSIGSTQYYCSTGSLSGSTCYYCNSGYLSGYYTCCGIGGNSSVCGSSSSTSASYGCPSGTQDGSTCYSYGTFHDRTSYSCPSGGSLSGTNCVINITSSDYKCTLYYQKATSYCGVNQYNSCPTPSCGCSVWGGWTNASSCTASTNVTQCRVVYN